MSFTLRQFQKLISAAKKSGHRKSFGDYDYETIETVEKFASQFWGVDFQQPFISKLGRLIDRKDNRVNNPASLIDSLVRAHGPNATLTSLLREEEKQDADQNSDGQSSDQDSGGDQPPNSSGDNSGDGDQTSEPPQHDQHWEPTPPKPTPPPPKTQKERRAEALQQLREQLREQQQAAKDQPPPQAGQKKAQQTALKQLKAQIRAASKQQSQLASAAGKIDGPSLLSRRRAAGTHGRLRRVPVALRNKTADIINLLVSEKGVAGDRLSPIPILSARKVVKRMVVRRPLSNALKEDSNSGRPVTLFLPDVSPSCERQAQIACDISNAAGYAGVSGSDVLVFPHSNGCVESGYVPWFNGRPNLVNDKEVQNLFSAITTGDSKYDIRVVVAIGDHDAEDLYREITARQSVRRFVWLHNFAASQYGVTEIIAPDGDHCLQKWTAEAKAKTTLVFGCVDSDSILAGLRLSIEKRRPKAAYTK